MIRFNANRAVPRLPVELLEDIFTHTSSSTRIALCQVSRQFNLLSIHLIYRDLTLTSPFSVVRCCQTLTSTPAAALAVKSMSLNFNRAPDFLFTSFHTLLGSALSTLSNILDLELLVPDHRYAPILKTCTFPRLVRFECHLTLCADVISFLNRHPTINYLQLSPGDHDLAPADSPPVVLPALEYFVGNNECLLGVIGSAALRAAFLSWVFGPLFMEECIEALEETSAESLKVLSCRRRGWNVDLIEIISVRLPDLVFLSIINVLVDDPHASEPTMTAFGRCLSRFTSLQRLLLNSVNFWDLADKECRMDDDFATVTAWGSVCPSLIECTLPYGSKWTRIHSNIWLPDPNHEEGSSWLLDKLCKRGYPEWGKIADVMEERMMEEVRIGKLSAVDFEETMTRLRNLEGLMDEGVEGEGEEDVGGDGDEEFPLE